MTLTFNAIDVETANANRTSICQIGIVHVRDGVISDHWQSLVNPSTWFDPLNVSIHGINESDVKNSPSFSDIRRELDRLDESILISHTSFDRVSVERALREYDLDPLRVTWLDSARIVRRAWPEQYGKSGWGLKNVATDLGIVFNHHDALEDARAAAQVVLKACTTTDTGIADWLQLVNRPIFPQSESAPVSRPEANPDGLLYGETILFTGALSIPRREAADRAAQAGCNVAGNASKKVTILVVGTQDESKLNGYEKSSNHRRVEALIGEGVGIDILSESDFYELLGIRESEIMSSAMSPPRSAKNKGGGAEARFVFELGEGNTFEHDENEQNYEVDIYEDADVPFAEVVTYVERATLYLENLEGCGMDDPIALVSEPSDDKESISVAVSCKEHRIGYLPRDLAKKIGAHLDAKGSYEAFLEENWEDIEACDAEENNVGLIVRINLDVIPTELVKEGRKAELPTEESLEALKKLIEDLESGR